MTGQIKFRVRYAETDAMGIVHHANYYVWFEMGRTELLREADLNYRSMEEAGIMSPVIESHCYYKSSARYDDYLTLETEVTSVDKVRWAFNYRVWRDGELLAEGRTVHCFMNREGRPVFLKKANPELYSKMVEKGILQSQARHTDDKNKKTTS